MTHQLRNALLPDEPPRAEDKPMTDDEFRAWALNEVRGQVKTNVVIAIDNWVDTEAPDDLTLGAIRALKTEVESVCLAAVSSGFNAGTSRSGPKVK